jgi:hypothetical protein
MRKVVTHEEMVTTMWIIKESASFPACSLEFVKG